MIVPPSTNMSLCQSRKASRTTTVPPIRTRFIRMKRLRQSAVLLLGGHVSASSVSFAPHQRRQRGIERREAVGGAVRASACSCSGRACGCRAASSIVELDSRRSPSASPRTGRRHLGAGPGRLGREPRLVRGAEIVEQRGQLRLVEPAQRPFASTREIVPGRHLVGHAVPVRADIGVGAEAGDDRALALERRRGAIAARDVEAEPVRRRRPSPAHGPQAGPSTQIVQKAMSATKASIASRSSQAKARFGCISRAPGCGARPCAPCGGPWRRRRRPCACLRASRRYLTSSSGRSPSADRSPARPCSRRNGRAARR